MPRIEPPVPSPASPAPSPAVELVERMLLHELAGHPEAVFQPRDSEEIPDEPYRFRLAYMGLEWADLDDDERFRRLDELHRLRGRTRRQFRNGLAFVLPDRAGRDEALRAAERLLSEAGETIKAIERAHYEGKGLDTLHGRLFRLYGHICIPRADQDYVGPTRFDVVPLGMDHLEASLHEGAMARLAARFRATIAPEELRSILGLGRTDAAGVHRVLFPMSEAGRWFFSFVNLPRFRDADPIRRAVAEGIARGVFGLLRNKGLHELDRLPGSGSGAAGDLIFERPFSPGDVEFEGGSYLVDGDEIRARRA